MVGHLNVLTNAVNCTLTTRVQKSFTTYNTALAVSWLPTFHDMVSTHSHTTPPHSSSSPHLFPQLLTSPLTSPLTPTCVFRVSSASTSPQ